MTLTVYYKYASRSEVAQQTIGLPLTLFLYHKLLKYENVKQVKIAYVRFSVLPDESRRNSVLACCSHYRLHPHCEILLQSVILKTMSNVDDVSNVYRRA